ncbi:MAG: helix-turn-helix domain-containing protein [Phycisphaerae bacterium]
MLTKSDTACGYFPVSDQAVSSGFYLTGAGVEHIKPGAPYPLPSHPDMYEFSWNIGRVLPEYQLIYVLTGAGEFESRETGLVKISPGTAMLLLPDVWHRYRPDPRIGWSDYWISFNGAIAHRWQQSGLLTPESAVVPHALHGRASVEILWNLVRAAMESSENPTATSLTALALLAGMLSESEIRHAPTAGNNKQPSPSLLHGDTLVRRALEVIWNHSHRNISSDRIAGQLGVTRRTLERHFALCHSRTVLEELTACRLARAKLMLRGTHLSIKRIAYATGFASVTHLGVVFRRKLNTTPAQYRAGMTD